jgi:hypothetical protein
MPFSQSLLHNQNEAKPRRLAYFRAASQRKETMMVHVHFTIHVLHDRESRVVRPERQLLWRVQKRHTPGSTATSVGLSIAVSRERA